MGCNCIIDCQRYMNEIEVKGISTIRNLKEGLKLKDEFFHDIDMEEIKPWDDDNYHLYCHDVEEPYSEYFTDAGWD